MSKLKIFQKIKDDVKKRFDILNHEFERPLVMGKL